MRMCIYKRAIFSKQLGRIVHQQVLSVCKAALKIEHEHNYLILIPCRRHPESSKIPGEGS